MDHKSLLTLEEIWKRNRNLFQLTIDNEGIPCRDDEKTFSYTWNTSKTRYFCKTESNSSRRDTAIVNFQLSIRYIPICCFLYKAKHRKKNAAQIGGISSKITYLFLFSHFWLAMPLLVLQADWQEVWHSPQPPFLALWHRLRVSMVWICFMGRFLLVLFLYS